MSTADAATATLIADRYLRQHLNTTAFSHTWRSWKGHGSGIQIRTHRQNSCQASFSALSRVWHLLSTAKLVWGAPTAGGGWAGPSGPPGVPCPPKCLMCRWSSFVLKDIYSLWQAGISKASLHVLHTDWEWSVPSRQEVRQQDRNWSYLIRGSLILLPAFSQVWTNLSASLNTALHLQGTRHQPALTVAHPGAHSAPQAATRQPPGGLCQSPLGTSEEQHNFYLAFIWGRPINNIIFSPKHLVRRSL